MTISDNNILVHELKLFNYVLPRGKKRWNFPPNFTPLPFRQIVSISSKGAIIRVVKHGDSDFISLASICLFALCCLPFANRETAINREA